MNQSDALFPGIGDGTWTKIKQEGLMSMAFPTTGEGCSCSTEQRRPTHHLV